MQYTITPTHQESLTYDTHKKILSHPIISNNKNTEQRDQAHPLHSGRGVTTHFWQQTHCQTSSSLFCCCCALLRGIIVNRTYGKYKNLYISLFLPTIFGPVYYVVICGCSAAAARVSSELVPLTRKVLLREKPQVQPDEWPQR